MFEVLKLLIYFKQKFTLKSWFIWKSGKLEIKKSKRKKKQKKLKPYIRINKKFITFYDTGTEEYKFYQYKKSVPTNDVDINEIVVSNKLPFGKKDFKYFVDYKVDKKKYTFIHILSHSI